MVLHLSSHWTASTWSPSDPSHLGLPNLSARYGNAEVTEEEQIPRRDSSFSDARHKQGRSLPGAGQVLAQFRRKDLALPLWQGGSITCASRTALEVACDSGRERNFLRDLQLRELRRRRSGPRPSATVVHSSGDAPRRTRATPPRRSRSASPTPSRLRRGILRTWSSSRFRALQQSVVYFHRKEPRPARGRRKGLSDRGCAPSRSWAGRSLAFSSAFRFSLSPKIATPRGKPLLSVQSSSDSGNQRGLS